jgi:hypothetical protein
MSNNDLSGAALNRAIAKLQGWCVERCTLSHSGDRLWFVLLRPDGSIFETEQGHLPRVFIDDPFAGDKLWEYAPDLAGDPGAALTLCLDCLDKLNARGVT